MVKMVNSDVLFDTGKQLFLYETMVNLTISVPITKGWHSRLLNVLSSCKRWPAELALSPPSLPLLLPLCRLTVSVFVCDIHLTVFDGLIPMIYFEYNKTNDHYKEKKHNNMRKWGFYAFIDTIMWIYNEIKRYFSWKEVCMLFPFQQNSAWPTFFHFTGIKCFLYAANTEDVGCKFSIMFVPVDTDGEKYPLFGSCKNCWMSHFWRNRNGWKYLQLSLKISSVVTRTTVGH